jgi:hypothetical protein
MRDPYGIKTLEMYRKQPSLVMVCFAPNRVVQFVRISPGLCVKPDGSMLTARINSLYSAASYSPSKVVVTPRGRGGGQENMRRVDWPGEVGMVWS